ncbi:anhydro-N-acetylmuramic acid kinase [Cryomorphaceae bacterium 1068]|nr:anhydro-N-acetylmuramic acid kinase [Cryomorphaceae bacterium 1068]
MQSNSPYSTDYQFGIGSMTGTSLDGLDLALCKFDEKGYEILDFNCFELPAQLRKNLNDAYTKNGREFFQIENDYSRFIAECINSFQNKTGSLARFIGIHGQTIFHEPNSQLTVQMLNGGLIAAETGLTTVCDFRRADMALDGQGAPLVPIGDRDLFGEYNACLNLGGFANLSAKVDGERVAFDICAVNIVLNLLAKKIGKDYDDRGQIAASGKLNRELLNQLNSLAFYKERPPKSLGREWMEQQILPLLAGIENNTALRTFTEHAAQQIAACLPREGKVLLTGGGAYNDFLISLIRERLPELQITIPEKKLLEGKEALIFAYLAKLRLEGETNVLASATGAFRNSSSGAVYIP